MECEQDIEEYRAEVNNPQYSIDESTISAYDINRAVQLKKKTRCLTDIEKLNYFNNHSIPASNFKFSTKQYGSRQCSFQFSWLKKFNGLVYSTDNEGA